MGLRVFGDQSHKMPNVTGVWIPEGVNGDRVRARAADGLQHRDRHLVRAAARASVWRIGAMGYNARQDAVLTTLAALEAVLAAEGFKLPRGAGIDAAREVYRQARA